MLVFNSEVQAVLACGPIESIAELVARQPGALRDAIVGAVLKVREPYFIACGQPRRIGQRIIWRKEGNKIDEVIFLVDESVDLIGRNRSRPVRQKGIVSVERLLTIGRRTEGPHLKAVINVQGPLERITQRDMVLRRRDPVAFGCDPYIVDKS